MTETKVKCDDFELQLGTLQINHEKLNQNYENLKSDHNDVVEKLH